MRKTAIILMALTVITRAYMLFIPHRSWDETIYTYLVLSLDKYGIFSYSLHNSLVFSSLSEKITSSLVPNFPLFVHPPLFSYTLFSIAKSMTINLKTIVYAAFILNTASIFLISVLIYKFALSVLNNEKLAFYMSLIVITEPVLWLSSLKIWMDAFLGALAALFIYFYLKAMNKNETKFIILTGIIGGLLLETKLSPLPLVLCIAAHSLLKARENKKFIFIAVISLVSLIPWILWNYITYGFSVPTAFAEYTMSYRPKIYEAWAHPLAYFVYLPIVSPVVLLGYINLIKTKKIDLLRTALIFVTVVFSAFSATRELRYITPLLFIHFILAAELLNEKRNLLKPAISFILIYNTAIVFLTLFFLNFSHAPDIIIAPWEYVKILIL